MMDNQDIKRELIIEAALKRFAHFGLQKTAMSEIAKDLNMSKALLYYYFPDKIHLYDAALKFIINDSAQSLKTLLKTSERPLESINLFLEQRFEFLKSYENLLDINRFLKNDVPEMLLNSFKYFRDIQVNILADILIEGRDRGQLKLTDPRETASLLIDALAGITKSANTGHRHFALPRKELWESIVERQKKLAAIFLAGLSA